MYRRGRDIYDEVDLWEEVFPKVEKVETEAEAAARQAEYSAQEKAALDAVLKMLTRDIAHIRVRFVGEDCDRPARLSDLMEDIEREGDAETLGEFLKTHRFQIDYDYFYIVDWET